MDAELLSEAGQVMMIILLKTKNLTELNKRYWLLDENKASIEQGQVGALRDGQIVKVVWEFGGAGDSLSPDLSAGVWRLETRRVFIYLAL